MRAVVMRNHKLTVDDLPIPQPGPGEVLVKTLACGICGSDLHALKYTEKLVEASRRSGGAFTMDLTRGIVMGHEFCAEVVEHGPATKKTLKTGTRVCSMPVLISPAGVQTVGYSNENPGGYGEFMRLTEGFDETLDLFDPSTVQPGDVVGIGIHTGNALRGYEVGKAARDRGAWVVYGGIHAHAVPGGAAHDGRRPRGGQGRRRRHLGARSSRIAWPAIPRADLRRRPRARRPDGPARGGT